MIKIFELLVRKPGIDAAAYLQQLQDAGLELAKADACLGYTVSESLPLPAREDIVQLDIPGTVDAFVEIWAADMPAYEALMESAAGTQWREMRAALVQAAKTLCVEEHPLIDVPASRPPARNNAFLTRHERLSREEFLHEWIGEHGEMCRRVPYLKGFVPCVVTAVIPQQDVAELATDDIEGIAQAYFDSQEDEFAMIKTPQAKEWFAHGAETFGLIKAFGARELSASAPSGENS